MEAKIKRPAGSEQGKIIDLNNINDTTKTAKKQDKNTYFTIKDIEAQYEKIEQAKEKAKEAKEIILSRQNSGLANIYELQENLILLNVHKESISENITQILKNWLFDTQFSKPEGVNIFYESATETIAVVDHIHIDNRIDKDKNRNDIDIVQRYQDLNSVKSFLMTYYKIKPDFVKIKKCDIPMRKMVFRLAGETVSNDEINIYQEPELHRITRETAENKERKQYETIYNEEIKENCRNIDIILTNLFAKEEERQYFINWIGYIVQTGEKTRNSIVIKGTQGTGKNVLFQHILKPFFGKRYTKVLNNMALDSQFSSDFENQLLIAFNEVQNFSERTKIAEKLKEIISDDFIYINQKHVKTYICENRLNCLFFSNNYAPVSVEGSDRRYSIFTANSVLEATYTKEEIRRIIKDIETELPIFFTSLFLLEVDKNQALTVYYNQEKEVIQKITQNIIDLMGEKIALRDFESLYNLLTEYLEQSNVPLRESQIQEFIDDLKSDINNKYIQTALLYRIYMYCMNYKSLESLALNDDGAASIEVKKGQMGIISQNKFTQRITAKTGLLKKTIRIENRTVNAWILD